MNIETIILAIDRLTNLYKAYMEYNAFDEAKAIREKINELVYLIK